MKTQEQQLDYALSKIMSELVAWGICDSESTSELGYRTPEVLRLSVAGATHLFDLINSISLEYTKWQKEYTELEKEIDRLNAEVNSPKI